MKSEKYCTTCDEFVRKIMKEIETLEDNQPPSGEIPECEKDSEKSCWNCKHSPICKIKKDFDKANFANWEFLNISLDLPRFLAKNCTQYDEV